MLLQMGHLDCFHVLPIVNRAEMNIEVHISFQVVAFSGYVPSSGIAGSYGSSVFSFSKGISILFSIVVVQIYIPINRVKEFPLSTSSPAFIVCRL